MDLMTLATMCIDDPAHQRHTEVLVQLASVAAQQNPWYVLDETTQQVFSPHTPEQAAGVAHALLRAGHVLRVGLALVPVERALAQGIALDVLWDPCTNLALAAEYIALPEHKGRRPSGVERAVWQLAVYLSPQRPEDALSFAAQVLQSPPTPGQEFSLDGASRVRVTFSKDARVSAPSIQIKLVPQRHATQPPEAAPALPPHSDAETPAATPSPEPKPIKVTASPLHAPAPTPSSTPRKPQPPVTQEKLPLSTKQAP